MQTWSRDKDSSGSIHINCSLLELFIKIRGMYLYNRSIDLYDWIEDIVKVKIVFILCYLG